MSKDQTVNTETWAPDSRWLLPVLFAVWSFAAGWLPAWSARAGDGFPPWLMAGAGVAVALVGVWRARHVWPVHTHGEALREQGSLLAVVVGIAIGWWLVVAGYSSPWSQLPLLLLMAAIGGGLFAALATAAPRHRAAETERAARVVEQVASNDMRDILDASDCSDVKLFAHTETRAGYTLTIGPDPSFPRRPNLSNVEQRLPDLTTNLAIYWRDRDGTELFEGDVRLEALAADRWYLHVSTKHVLREDIPFRLSRAPSSFNLPLWLGLFEDGAAMRFTLCRAGCKVVGATGGGKSVIVNNLLGRVLECRNAAGDADALAWVCASEKLVPLVYPWLLPWLNRQTAHPAIDMVVGEDPDDVGDFLRRLYFLAKDRNARLSRKSKHEASPGTPGIVVFVEEAKVLTGLSKRVHMGGDEWWTLSRLLAEIAALERSAAISLVLITQVGLFDGLGDYGDELQRHLTIRACTVTMTASDGYNTLPALPATVDTTMLRDHSMYLQVGITEESRAMPGKAADLDEERVPVVARAVSSSQAHLTGRDLDAFGADYYAGRWDAERVPVIAAAAADDDEAPNGVGYTWPVLGPQGVATHLVHTVPPVSADPPMPEQRDEPVDTTPGDDINIQWEPEWDAELRDLLGDDSGGIVPEGEIDPNGPYGFAIEHIARLEQLARQLEREADEADAQPYDDATSRLPQPLGAVIAHLDTIEPPPRWVSTAELAAIVLGEGVTNGAVKLGKALGKVTGGVLKSTEPREVPGGGRARGYVVADLYRAAVAHRDGTAPDIDVE